MAIKKAIYQVDNGTDFDEVHFKTSASQVYAEDGTDIESNISSLQTKVDNGQNHKLTADNGISFELSSADLNAVTKTGNYVGNKWVNGPSTSYAIVEVTQGTSGMVKQVFTETTSTNQYMRIYRSSAWSEWREL